MKCSSAPLQCQLAWWRVSCCRVRLSTRRVTQNSPQPGTARVFPSPLPPYPSRGYSQTHSSSKIHTIYYIRVRYILFIRLHSIHTTPAWRIRVFCASFGSVVVEFCNIIEAHRCGTSYDDVHRAPRHAGFCVVRRCGKRFSILFMAFQSNTLLVARGNQQKRRGLSLLPAVCLSSWLSHSAWWCSASLL